MRQFSMPRLFNGHTSASAGRGHDANVVGRLHEELTLLGPHDDDGQCASSAPEALYRQVARAKARWLRRIMYGTVATSTEKCFAYAVADHLNCVTLDAWPSQLRLAQYLGFKSVKTIQRAAGGLERLEVLVLTWAGKHQCRYAPKFLPADEDRNVPTAGQTGPRSKDKDVCQSLLLIHINSSDPSKRLSEKSGYGRDSEFQYRRTERGGIEVKIAGMMGDEGMEVLSRLSSIDDSIIERLCRAYAAGALGERELVAARLAAEQVR
jgi:hypothetical protein